MAHNKDFGEEVLFPALIQPIVVGSCKHATLVSFGEDEAALHWAFGTPDPASYLAYYSFKYLL